MTKHQRWLAIIEKWHESDLTQKQFCVEQNIKLCSFQYWFKKQRFELEPNAEKAGFVPVSVSSAPAQKIELLIGQAVFKPDLKLLPDILAQLNQTGWLHARSERATQVYL